MKPFKTFPKIRTVIETQTEIIVKGHCGVCELEEEIFSKSEYYVQINNLDNEIKIYKKEL